MSEWPAFIPQLQYRTPGGWTALPDWALFLLQAGARVAIAEPEQGRLAIALSLPARAFAAALAAAGAVIASFCARPPGADAAAHFEYLASLPEGTAIAHHRGNFVQQGRLIGWDLDPADDALKIKFRTSRGDVLWFPEKLCTEIQVIDDPGILKVHKQKLVKEPAFLASALPGIDIRALSAQTSLDCVLVGAQRSLEAELTARDFGAGTRDQVYEGHLQAIVRVRDVAGTRDPYRSAVIPATSDDGDVPVTASTPRLAIFDGARAFDSWRSRLPHSNWLVLIDRGLPAASDGAATVSQEYATRLATADVLDGLRLPAGIEALAWLQRR